MNGYNLFIPTKKPLNLNQFLNLKIETNIIKCFDGENIYYNILAIRVNGFLFTNEYFI